MRRHACSFFPLFTVFWVCFCKFLFLTCKSEGKLCHYTCGIPLPGRNPLGGRENGQKSSSINKIATRPFGASCFRFCFILSKRCITPNYTKGAFGLPKLCRWPKRTAKKTKMYIRSVEALTGAKTGSVFVPGFHSAGDGMKATIVISPLRREFWTFFGLYTAKGEIGQKRRPYK